MKKSGLAKGESKKTLLRLMGYILPMRGLTALAVICSAAYVVFTLITPVLTGNAIDLIIAPGQVDLSALPYHAIVLAVCFSAAAFFGWLVSLCTNRISYKTAEKLRADCFEKISSAPFSYIDSNAHGDLKSRMINDVDAVSDGLLLGISQLFTGVSTVLGVMGIMLILNPIIAAVVIVLTPLSIVVSSFVSRGLHRSFKDVSELTGKISAFGGEHIANRRLVAAFSYEDRAAENFEAVNEKLRTRGISAQFFSALVNPSTRFVNSLVYAAAGVTGAILAISGSVTPGQLSAFLSYANQYTKPFNEISGVVAQMQSAIASAARIFEILDAPEEQDTAVADNALPAPDNCRGSVTLTDVEFSYIPDVPLIRNLTLNVPPASRVAIVGPTGCGKTTLINLLMRFYDPIRGSIAIDGADCGTAPRDSVRALYGIVLQNTWLFGGTIRDNIAYGKPDATDEEICEAAKKAHIHGFIERLPDGYNTVIGEGSGIEISEGQRQLLCIARVILTDPPMLILDEATSSIDTKTERRIQRSFDAMMQGRTSFIVAHRLSTVREADVILVMRDGDIVEQGKHEDLLAKGGFYAHLWESQFKGQAI